MRCLMNVVRGREEELTERLLQNRHLSHCKQSGKISKPLALGLNTTPLISSHVFSHSERSASAPRPKDRPSFSQPYHTSRTSSSPSVPAPPFSLRHITSASFPIRCPALPHTNLVPDSDPPTLLQ